MAAGCGSSEPGEPDAAPETNEPAVWDPCEELPDDVIAGIGFDPSSMEREIAGVEQPGWQICTWRGERKGLTILTTVTRSLDSLRDEADNVDKRSVAIPDPDSQIWRPAHSIDTVCEIMWPIGDGAG
nr:DUF3558 family protein [Rhodococcus rhodnii]